MLKTTTETGASLEQIKISQEIIKILNKHKGGSILNVLSITTLQFFHMIYLKEPKMAEEVAFEYLENLKQNFETFFKDMKAGINGKKCFEYLEKKDPNETALKEIYKDEA